MTALTLSDFNRDYIQLHVAKEDLFWTTYMGTEPDGSKLEIAEGAYKAWISDPARLREVREALAVTAATDADELQGLTGWQHFFQANGIDSDEGRRLQGKLIELESQLFQKRAKFQMFYEDTKGERHQGSTNVMAAHIAANADETVRKTSHQALRTLEQWVLDNGFLDIVRERNAFARALGFPDYFEYKIQKNEQMSRARLFQILDEFEAMTRDTHLAALERLGNDKGAQALEPWNLKYSVAGSVQQELDPYLPFEHSLQRWAKSFARLGIGYRGAELVLDLCDRPGKYENGFMHGPQPCFFDKGTWRPARIHFTSNATPSQVGSGRAGLTTLFHEGGHAAHFANITGNAPCFSQEYPPTSMALAETQSMFCDSLIGDADWLALYARDLNGKPVPEALLQAVVTADQPFRAFNERMLLLVPTFESRLYAMDDAARTPEAVLELARKCEREVLGIAGSPRPLLAIPHLLSGEGAASYQGYLLAHMGVYQTRAFFQVRDGQLTDNPRIGPDLAKHYWNPGNSQSHDQTLHGLTGHGLSGRALAEFCNVAPDTLWQQAREAMLEAMVRPKTETQADLHASIRIVHGAQLIADNTVSMQAMWDAFAAWVTGLR
jgi:hypothetical protein